jgi:hypothetical protein
MSRLVGDHHADVVPHVHLLPERGRLLPGLGLASAAVAHGITHQLDGILPYEEGLGILL